MTEWNIWTILCWIHIFNIPLNVEQGWGEALPQVQSTKSTKHIRQRITNGIAENAVFTIGLEAHRKEHDLLGQEMGKVHICILSIMDAELSLA